MNFKKPLLSLAVACYLMMAAGSATAFTPAQSPLFIAGNVEPNVMFTLDDSGSMQWEIMPDPVFFAYLMPQALNPYGGATYGRNIPRFRDNYNLNLRSRNPQINNIFYNPEVNYVPWSNADGSLFVASDPDNALLNPTIPANGTMDLDSLNTWTNWSGGGPNDTGIDNQFWPITFYMYDGTGNIDSPANYTKFQIRENAAFTATPANAPMVPLTTFNWPGPITRTITQEKQNFANWFTYYRSRILASRGAIGTAFTTLPDQARVGFGAINQGTGNIDGVNTPTVVSGVRDFNLAGRSTFYDRLYDRVINNSGTPLRRGAEDVGEYFERDDDRGPWSSTPGASGGNILACRQSFSILMTDGFWNGPNPAVGDSDGSAGINITGPDLGAGPQSYTYAPVPPFSDTRANTLADVAMHYWKRDLLPTVENRISVSPENPAFWQHLTSFGVGLGVQGNVVPADAFAAIGTGTPIAWGNPFTDNAAKVDDLLHFGLNGRGGFFSAGDPESFANELSNVLLEIVGRVSATTGVSVSSTRLNLTSTAFEAEFDSSDWTGELKAINVLSGMTMWEASPDLDARLPAGRKILTSAASGTLGISFDTGMDPALKSLISTTPAQADNVINFVRGANIPGFRVRASVLSDIVNSRPIFIGPGNEGWSRLAGAEGSAYNAHVDAKETTLGQAVVVGANGGMLHAFDSTFGTELFGFVPRAVLPKLEDLTIEPYSHRYYVDGQQTVSDAYLGGAWTRVLVGSLGAGGRGIYAIDVKDPSNPTVLWEITDTEDPELGFTFGEPAITRLENGRWVAIFGNGYGGDSGQASLHVRYLEDGSLVVPPVNLGPAGDNGLSGVAVLLDPVSQTFVNRVYAGDLEGNMWRVDFSSSSASVAFSGSPLFTVPPGPGGPNRRSITVTPALAASPSGGLFVYFGSGKLIESSDRPAPSINESFWAVRDTNSPISGTSGFGAASITISGGNRVVNGAQGTDGWYLPFDLSGSEGERVLTNARVIFGRLVFSSFEPDDDPCATGGIQRLYLLDALSGEGLLDDICPNCGVIEIGSGSPIEPPVVLNPAVPPPFTPPAPGDPAPPPPMPPGVDPAVAREGWCSEFGILTPGTGFLPLGTLCDGRQAWRQVIDN